MNDFDIFDKSNSRLKLTMLVSTTMLIIGVVIKLVSDSYTAYFLIVMALLLVYVSWKNHSEYRKALNDIDDRDAFECELKTARCFSGMGLMLTDSYAVVVKPSLRIYAFAKMDKFEVGIAEGREKVLFLTDAQGTRYRIARTLSGDGNQTAFDEVYHYVSNKFNL
ncbi:hypothetical protein O6R05_05085 [Peptoniphilus equinus]|uniref:Uncharacterized protein n=1 Tax=Peptoniphilus equinus TaxID=3016343 RepID=A0ABY7QRG9_9FIRM|nr:hypothetical protein [Peptoniphilus equinus]WBW49387.1 hypothetical protein O6R05_05085 [Peptoniphilus equinus]